MNKAVDIVIDSLNKIVLDQVYLAIKQQTFCTTNLRTYVNVFAVINQETITI